MQSQLEKAEKNIGDLRPSLACGYGIHVATAVNRMEKQKTKRHELSPSELLECQPEGIDDQVREVKEKLDIQGSEPAVAVVLWGFGGVGKSTLANSVLKDMDLKSTNFMFSRVIIDSQTSEKTSHIVKLQRDIISDFGGGKVDLRDPAEGRHELSKVLENKFCLLFIDNVVDSDCIEKLLPKNFLQSETSDPMSHKETSDPMSHKQTSKLRILITSRENNLKPLLDIKRVEDYHVEVISDEAARNLLTKTILQGEGKLQEQFDEMGCINAVAQACHGVPILLSIFGNYLKVERNESSYKDVLQALQGGKLDKYRSGDEELLSKKLFFVYDRMRDEEDKEAFLDICTYFQGGEWNEIAHVVGESSLQALLKRKLVNKSESNTVIVHDILRSIGTEESKFTRLRNYEEFSNVEDNVTELQKIKGLALLSTTSLTRLDCKHLNAMHNSLRVLQLGDWVRLENPPCEDAFKELRYLQIGDLKDFPFTDASKLKKLRVFYNRSMPGMELDQLPPNLTRISHQVPYRDCNAFTNIPFKDLKSLERFQVRTKRHVCLPQGSKLPVSLINLELIGCNMLPKQFGKLTALQSLILDECDMEYLPQGFEQLTKLGRLSMNCCKNLRALPDRFGSSDGLTYLSLWGCTSLEKLPAGLGILRALQELNISICTNLTALPDVFTELSALQMLDLKACVSLQKLPDSFGRLHLQSLNLHFLSSLEELPESFGDLPCLTNLSLRLCESLKRLPKSFGKLRKLEDLTIRECFKLSLSDCPLVREVSGFQQLSNLKSLTLIDCRSVLNLPMGFEECSCLEKLHMVALPLSSLPDGFGMLKNLKVLWIAFCYKLERVSEDFQSLVCLEELSFDNCPMLDGETMDKIVKLQHCQYVHILKSTKLIQRWTEKKDDMTKESSMRIWIRRGEELYAVGRLNLFSGECIQLDSTGRQLIYGSSMLVSDKTTVLVISGEFQQDHLKPIAKEMIEKATERANINCSGQLRIIYVCSRVKPYGHCFACSGARYYGQLPPTKQEEMERTRQILTLLPPGVSYAIPSTDLRRLHLIGAALFGNEDILCHRPNEHRFVCFIAEMTADGCLYTCPEAFKTEVCAGTSAHKLPGSESSDEENEVPDKIEELINFICERRAHQSLPGDTIPMVSKFIEALKNNGIHHFVDGNQRMVGMDQLKGKHLALIMIDLHSQECIKLQEIYASIESKGWNFEAIWIAVAESEDFGFGTYSRAIQRMRGIFLPDPKLINLQDIKTKSPRIIMFNQEGHIVNLDALPLIMSWGADEYPFNENVVSQIVSKMHKKSNLDVLFDGMTYSTQVGIQDYEIMRNKCIFLYAEPLRPQFNKMNSMLEQFAQTQENLAILYVGSYFCQGNDAESVDEVYESATSNMRWPKLSFWDMMKFWYRCKCLFTNIDKMEEEVRLSLTSLQRILKHLLDEERWLILLDRDGIVTASGKDVVELVCRSVNEENDYVDIWLKRELTESLENGKCNQVVRTFFKDEISDFPHHPHPLMLRWKKGNLLCDTCDRGILCAPHAKRIYTCEACNWDLCGDCWEVFAKEQIKASNQI